MVTMLTNSTQQLIQVQNKPSTFILKAMEQPVIKPEDNSNLDRLTDLTGTWQTKKMRSTTCHVVSLYLQLIFKMRTV